MLFQLSLAGAQLAAPIPTTDQPAPPAVTTPFSAASRLDTAAMNQATAQEDVGQIATANQSASVTNSQVNGNSRTGAVGMDGNAFQNMSGFAIINANSGNNVAVNAAINVNVNITPVP